MVRALIVVDVQVDFCEGGALAVAGGNALAERLSTWLGADRGYEHLLATRDWHVDPGRHFSAQPDLRRSWPPHCWADSPGAQLHPALAGIAFAAVFDKGQYDDGYSGFDGTDNRVRPLSAYLRAHDVTALDVVGIATDHCVGATATDAARLGWQTRVLTDLVAGVDDAASARRMGEFQRAGGTLADSRS